MHALDDKVSVSPQIAAEDLGPLKAAGYTTVICNRPDTEVPEYLSAASLGSEAEAAGLDFATVPLAPGMLSLDLIQAHLAAIDAAPGKVLAYCASGTRSAYLWAFAMAAGQRLDNAMILEALDRAGFPSPGLGPQLDQIRAMAAG